MAMTLDTPIKPKVLGVADTSNFDKYPRDEIVPADEVSGWDKDFQIPSFRCETNSAFY